MFFGGKIEIDTKLSESLKEPEYNLFVFENSVSNCRHGRDLGRRSLPWSFLRKLRYQL